MHCIMRAPASNAASKRPFGAVGAALTGKGWVSEPDIHCAEFLRIAVVRPSVSRGISARLMYALGMTQRRKEIEAFVQRFIVEIMAAEWAEMTAPQTITGQFNAWGVTTREGRRRWIGATAENTLTALAPSSTVLVIIGVYGETKG